MREVLFRGKTIETPSRWIYGSFWKESDNYCILTSEDCIGHHIYKESLGQFTGLLDKNNNKIFEGDILNAFGDRPMEVFWNKETLSWEMRDEGTKDCEVNHLINTVSLGEILVEAEYNEVRTVIIDNVFDKYVKNSKKSKGDKTSVACTEEYIKSIPSCIECKNIHNDILCENCKDFSRYKEWMF